MMGREAGTLGGLIFEMAGRVPVRGEVIRHDSGIEFEIMDSDLRRVKRVRIKRAGEGAKPAATAATELKASVGG